MYYDVKIIRSRRKTAAIEINRDAEVILRLPFGATDEYASRLLDEKADWIARHLIKARARVRVGGSLFRARVARARR